MDTPDTVVFGAAGFIGRSLVARLLEQGRTVAAAVRPGSADRLQAWLDDRDLDRSRLTVLDCDITDPGLGALGTAQLDEVRDVYNCAAQFSFGLDHAVARAVNIDGAVRILHWSASRPRLRRLVHITGYRVTVPESAEHDYSVSAYGASKFEADAVLREQANSVAVPLTIANPSTVLGPGQYIGLAELVRDLWNGDLPALPGNAETLLPILDLDYFIDFLTLLPEQADTAGKSYTVLDPASPPLPEMIGLLARHMHVRAPRFTIPLPLVARLPGKLTGVDRERLSFVAGDRYDTSPADAVAERAGLTAPAAGTVLRAWADHLVSSRFGAGRADPAAGFDRGLWISGERKSPEFVLLHGLPTDSEAWREVRDLVGVPTLAADLPGLGRSAPGTGEPDQWLDDLMAPVTGRPILVGHSLGCVPVLRYARAHPDRVAGVVLVAPAFLQPRGSWLLRTPIAAALLRRLSAERLAAALRVPAGPAIESASANLRRPGVARRTVAALRAASRPRAHTAARRLLDELTVPVHIVAGSDDPLATPVTTPITEIDDAGHYPHLTHPGESARTLDAVRQNFANRSPAETATSRH
ncbi:alpha/beta fold hydrolase [Nocardia sp. NBC_01329]|uniref:alpha/beta fold hydrolase n=1 Tax=Nocardia sp. NBC_01329 TaxID=2903594 RepID=UPI002E119F54|nr:alpha/beta fold hydrolase [Nocardia sp. NBC_01329]